jgi:hypothetical protein
LVDSLAVQCYNKHMNKTNELIQWLGTAFILGMYVISNFFPGYDDLRNAVALVGAACFFAWSYRVANKQQMIINGVAIVLCVVGLFNSLG